MDDFINDDDAVMPKDIDAEETDPDMGLTDDTSDEE